MGLSRTEDRHDALTVAAVSVLAFVLANLLHEGGGHGLACAAVGGKPELLSTVNFECGKQGLADWQGRFVSLAGALINAAAGVATYAAWRAWRGTASSALRWFLGLFAVLNVFQAGGYWLFLYPFGAGDGAAVADWPWAARLGFAALGAAVYFLVGKRMLAEVLDDFSGGRALARWSYWAGCSAVCLAGVRNPVGVKYLLGSAIPSTFCGAIGLLRLPPADRSAGPAVGRGKAWIAASAVAFAVYVAALGTGWRF